MGLAFFRGEFVIGHNNATLKYFIYIQVTAKKLPQNRQILEDSEFGFEEPEVIPEGKLTLRHALEFIVKHQDDPQKNSVEQIAKDYNLQTSHVNEVLKHFQTFQMHLSTDFASKHKKIIRKEISLDEPKVYKLTSARSDNKKKIEEKPVTLNPTEKIPSE